MPSHNLHSKYMQWNFHFEQIMMQMLILLGKNFITYEIQLTDNLNL